MVKINRVEIVVGSQDNSKLDLEGLKHRLQDVGKMIETARVRVAGDKEAQVQLERMALKLAGLGKLAASPRITLTGAARAEVDIAAVELALDKLGGKYAIAQAKVGGLSGVLKGLGKALGGAGIFAGGALGAGLTGPFAAAGLAAGAFGAVAIPVLKDTMAAVKANETAQTAYNDSVAKARLAYSQATSGATSARQKTAALAAEQKALAAAQLTLQQHTTKLGGSQQQLADSVGRLQQAWQRTEAAMAPVVVAVAGMGLKLASALLPALNQLVPAGAKVIDAVLVPMTRLFSSPFFASFTDQMSQLAVQVAPLLGQVLTQLLVVFMQLFMQAGPAAVQVLSALLPAIVAIAAGLVPLIAGITRVVAVVVGWLDKTHLLIPALIAVGVAMAAAWALGTGGISLLITAIALVAGGLIHLWQTSQTFRGIVTGVFSVVGQAVLTWAELLIDQYHIVATGFLDMVHYILVGAQGIAKAIDWVMGTHLASGVTSALRSFDNFHRGVDNVFNAAHGKIEGWKRDLASMPRVVAIQGNINDLSAKLAAAKRQLADPHLTATRRAQVKANIAQLEAALARARAQLAAINGTVATTYVDTVYSSGPGSGPTAGHRGGHPLATGGITGAAGGGPRGNWTLVGEHGMELVQLPPGAMVRSNPDTQRILGQGGGAQVIELRVISTGQGDFDRFMAWWIKQYVRVNGGRGNPNNVQLAFGN